MEPRTKNNNKKTQKTKKKRNKKTKETLKQNPEANCMVCTWLKKDEMVIEIRYSSFANAFDCNTNAESNVDLSELCSFFR